MSSKLDGAIQLLDNTPDCDKAIAVPSLNSADINITSVVPTAPVRVLDVPMSSAISKAVINACSSLTTT